jgi:hypothetical protein
MAPRLSNWLPQIKGDSHVEIFQKQLGENGLDAWVGSTMLVASFSQPPLVHIKRSCLAIAHSIHPFESHFFSLKWGSPSLCIKMMHTAIFISVYSTIVGKKPYIDHTNRSHQTKVSKHHHTSTKLEE